jgi:hypothetical protein
MNLETDAEACEKEAKRLADRARSLRTQADRLRQRMICALDALGGTVRTPRFTIWTQTSAPFTGFNLAPDADMEAVREMAPELVRAEFSLDKKKLLEMHRKGETIPRCINYTENPGTKFVRIR